MSIITTQYGDPQESQKKENSSIPLTPSITALIDLEIGDSEYNQEIYSLVLASSALDLLYESDNDDPLIVSPTLEEINKLLDWLDCL